jgi:uncharacterized protein YbjT (DUF2867 family)
MTKNSVILVTGASGTVGRHVAAALADGNFRVRALSRAPARQPRHPQLDWVRFDYRDHSTFQPALEGVERLFVLSPTGVVDSAGFTSDFLDAALSRVRRVVLLTAQGVERSEAIPHRQLELRIERSGLDYVVLRPTWYADNFHTFWRSQILERGAISLPAARSRTAFVDARDIAACAVSALVRDEFSRRTFILTGPEALTYDEAAEVLGKECGRTIRYIDVSEEAFVEDVIRQGMPPDYAQMVAGLLVGVRAGGTAAITRDVHTLTGRDPRSLREYAAAHAREWLQARANV